MKNNTRRRGGMIRFASPGTPITQGFHFPQQHGPTPFGAHAATVRATTAAQAASAHAQAASAHAQVAAQAAHVSPRQSRKRRQSRSRSRPRSSSRRMSH